MAQSAAEILRLLPYNYDYFVRFVEYYATTSSAPVAAFTADATTVTVNTFIAFTNESTGEDPKTYSWDFGNGAKSSSTSPNYAYTEPGLYTVTLLVEDGVGIQASLIKVNYITVTA